METVIGRKADLIVDGILKFSATEVKVTAETDAGRAFLAEAVGSRIPVESITVPKSQAFKVLEATARAGLIEVVL